MTKNRLIELFHESGAIEFGNFELASGKKTDYFINAKKVIKNKEGARIISNITCEKLSEIENRKNKKYRIAGVYEGGYLFADEIGYRRKEMILIVDHKTNRHWGWVNENENYILFEDVRTTGQSILKCVKIMRDANLKVDHVLALVDRQEEPIDNLTKEGLDYDCILTKADLRI